MEIFLSASKNMYREMFLSPSNNIEGDILVRETSLNRQQNIDV